MDARDPDIVEDDVAPGRAPEGVEALRLPTQEEIPKAEERIRFQTSETAHGKPRSGRPDGGNLGAKRGHVWPRVSRARGPGMLQRDAWRPVCTRWPVRGNPLLGFMSFCT